MPAASRERISDSVRDGISRPVFGLPRFVRRRSAESGTVFDNIHSFGKEMFKGTQIGAPSSREGPSGPPARNSAPRRRAFAGRSRMVWSLAIPLLAASPVLALDPNRTLTQFGLDLWQRRQGLPQASATAIAPGNDGYLWVGTEEGLARFDGVRFTVFDRKNTPELERHNITTLFVSRDGTLWIGTMGGGLVRYAEGRFRRYGSKEGLTDEIVSAIAEDREGTLWVGTFHSGVAKLRSDRFDFLTTAQGLSNDEVRAIFIDAGGAVWIGTRGGGLNRFFQGQFTRFTTDNGLSNDQVTAICGDGSEGIWVATRNG